MIIGTAKLKLYAPWVHSLKEKRMVVKPIVTRVKNKFNVSIAEIDAQDLHQTIVLGIACVADSVRLADSILDAVIAFVEESTEAEIGDIQREIR